MSTLRDRVLALVYTAGTGETADQERAICDIALAAARMALEDAEKACREKAQHDYLEAASHKPGLNLLRRVAMGNRCDDCAEDIVSLRDGLD